jgi:F-type H+-transporting ATPase subunit epsilon
MKQFLLQVVSQERELISQEVESLTVPTQVGEVTILPDHAPLFSKVMAGVMMYRTAGEERFFVVSNGFLDVSDANKVTVLVDSAVADREISEKRAQAAIQAANETMSKTVDQRELLMAEASLRQAMLELKIAQKTRRTSI